MEFINYIGLYLNIIKLMIYIRYHLFKLDRMDLMIYRLTDWINIIWILVRLLMFECWIFINNLLFLFFIVNLGIFIMIFENCQLLLILELR